MLFISPFTLHYLICCSSMFHQNPKKENKSGSCSKNFTYPEDYLLTGFEQIVKNCGLGGGKRSMLPQLYICRAPTVNGTVNFTSMSCYGQPQVK